MKALDRKLLRDLRLPDFRDYAIDLPHPGTVKAEATRCQGELIRDVIRLNPHTFRVFSPDETASNRWGAVFEVTQRCSTASTTYLLSLTTVTSMPGFFSDSRPTITANSSMRLFVVLRNPPHSSLRCLPLSITTP